MITYYSNLDEQIYNSGFYCAEDLEKYLNILKIPFINLSHWTSLNESAIIKVGKYITEDYRTALYKKQIIIFWTLSKKGNYSVFYMVETREKLLKILKLKIFS